MELKKKRKKQVQMLRLTEKTHANKAGICTV